MNSMFINALSKTPSLVETENGALGYSKSRSPFSDIMFNITMFRGGEASKLVVLKHMWQQCLTTDADAAMRLMYYIRDARNGVGERDLFRNIFAITLDSPILSNEVTLARLLYLSAEFGRWDDTWEILNSPLFPPSQKQRFKKALKLIIEGQIAEDISSLRASCSSARSGCPISLIGKWLPSTNAGKRSKEMSKMIRGLINVPEDKYRKMLSLLRKHLDVVEVKMSANDWVNIKYPNVPSKAALKYKNAFMKHDPIRYTSFIDQVKKGIEKINGGVNFPHDIVHTYVREGKRGRAGILVENDVLEELWKALPQYFEEKSTLVVCDTSGSMCSSIPGSSCTAHEVANALAIYTSEHLKGPYKDKVVLFSAHPEYIDLSGCAKLCDKISLLEAYNECSNTDIERTFDLILKTAVDNKLKQEDLPTSVLVISDMQFDWAMNRETDKALMDTIAEKFIAAGYAMPKLVFWNLCAREYGLSTVVPMVDNPAGVGLLSGFSANLLKLALSGKTDPWEAIKDIIYSNRYDIISEVLNDAGKEETK